MPVECFLDGCTGEFSEEGTNLGIVPKNFIILLHSPGYGHLGCPCMVASCGRNRAAPCSLDSALFNGPTSSEIGVVCILGIRNRPLLVLVASNDREGADGKNYDTEGFPYHGRSHVRASRRLAGRLLANILCSCTGGFHT